MAFFHHPLTIPIISLIAGIVILVAPRVLNYIVSFYLIIMSILGFIKYFR